MNGDVILTSLKGNRISGNGFVEAREILLDLRFKVYYVQQPLVLKFKIVFLILFFLIFYDKIEKRDVFMSNKKKASNDEFMELVIETRQKEKVNKKKTDSKWIIKIIVIAFSLSFLLSYVSQVTIPNLSLFFGILITLLFVFLGIIFDIIGVAVTSSDEKVFHSMNSRKVKGADVAVVFKKNASKVSNFCCDVVGDVCGIISGTAATTIATILASRFDLNLLFTGLVVAALVAALTIGGKALGKGFAINKSDIILYEFAKFVSFFYKSK